MFDGLNGFQWKTIGNHCFLLDFIENPIGDHWFLDGFQ